MPRILKNLLARCDIRLALTIVDQFLRSCYRCDNEEFGCDVVVKLDILAMHLKVITDTQKLNKIQITIQECEHNPKKPVPCALGCGLTVPKDEMVKL